MTINTNEAQERLLELVKQAKDVDIKSIASEEIVVMLEGQERS